MGRAVFALEPVLPFRLDLTAWVLRRHPDNQVDRWDGEAYRRVLLIDGAPVEIAVRQLARRGRTLAEVSAVGTSIVGDLRGRLAPIVSRMLGLDVNLGGFYRLAACDPALGALARRFAGAKPTRFASIFEGLINAICFQQLTTTVGVMLMNRLAAKWGTAAHGGRGGHAFPEPGDLARATAAQLKRLGLSRQKAAALLNLSRSAARGEVEFDTLEAADDETAMERLLGLHGIGRWSAEYVLRRSLGRLTVFPGDDVAGQHNLRRLLGLSARHRLDYKRVRRILARWNPYEGLVYFHFLLQRLAERGLIE